MLREPASPSAIGGRSVAKDLPHEPRGGDDAGGAIRQGAVEDEEVGVSGYEVVDVADESGGKDVGVVGITPLTTMFVSTSTRSISRRLAFTIALFANGIEFGGDDGRNALRAGLREFCRLRLHHDAHKRLGAAWS